MYTASRGDRASIDRMRRLIETSENSSQQKNILPRVPAKLSPLQKKKADNIAFQRQTRERHPNAEPILSRPRPFVSGKRHIPVLVSARGVPFLRIKKPQPMNLTRMIRFKLAFKDKLIERRERLLIDSLFAKDEEDWDRLVEGQPTTPPVLSGNDPGPWIQGSWLESPLESYRKAFYDNIEFERKQQELAEKMWQVVLAERKLAAEEAARNEPSQNA